MKNINKSFGSVFAVVGCLVSRRNWFLVVVVPAIRNQRYAVAVMLGTHGRRGLLLGNRWFFAK